MQQSTDTDLSVINSLSNNLIAVSESMESLALRQSQIRWFYREPQDKKWTAFNGYDSLRLEAKHRATEASKPNLHLSISWPDDLDNSRIVKNTPVNKQCEHPALSGEQETHNLRVTVLGGLYEVDIHSLCCSPIYWTAGKRPMKVLRGVWFRDSAGTLEPLDDDSMVEQLESDYLKWYSHRDSNEDERYDPSGKTAPQSAISTRSSTDKTRRPLQSAASAPVLYTVSDVVTETTSRSCDGLGRAALPLTEISTLTSSPTDSKRKFPIHTVRFMDCHVDWYGPDEMYLYQDSTSLYIRQKLGMQKVGTRLYRGYNLEAQPNDKPPDVTHLCFVIHGIGQKMGTNPILKCCNDFRNMCNRLKCKHFPGLDAANQRVEFLPVEWRSSLQLDGDTVDSITPIHVRGLRTTLNSSAMDIMYYTSPLYRAEISASLLSELNRLYRMFCVRNPRFESRGGKVSVLAHSLGCVLIYDLITGWSRPMFNPTDLSASPQLSCLNFIDSEAPDSGEVQMNSGEQTRPDHEADTCNGKSFRSHTDGSGPSDSAPSIGSYPNSYSSQNLQRMARVSLQLEAARTVVSRLEQELSYLVQTRDRSSSVGSVLGDKQATSPSSVLMSDGADGATVADATPECSYFTTNSLLFKSNLENFFCLGSPLPVFLALRGIRPGAYTTQDNILPRRLCPRIFNIYHPADPVAYRLEPLVLKHYSSIQPALIHRADAIHKPDYDRIALISSSGKEVKRHRLSECYRAEPEDNTSPSRLTSPRKTDQFEPPPAKQTNRQRSPSIPRGSFASRVLGFFSRAAADSGGATQPATNGDPTEPVMEPEACEDTVTPTLQLLSDRFSDDLDYSNPHGSQGSMEALADTDTDDTITSLQLEHRIDFQLRASRYENMYISILTSHTGYWTNADVGMLILTQLFGSTHPPK